MAKDTTVVYDSDCLCEFFTTKDGRNWLIYYNQDDSDPMQLYHVLDAGTTPSRLEEPPEKFYIVEYPCYWSFDFSLYVYGLKD